MHSFLKRAVIRLLALVAITVLVLQARHYIANVHPHASSDVQRIALVNPRPEPPRREPEAETKTPEPTPIETTPSQKTEFFKYDEYGPGSSGPGDGPPSIRDDLLGLDTAGGVGGRDSYGLVGKRGGKDITTLANAVVGGNSGGSGGGGGHGEGGPMARFAGYATLLKDLVAAELNRHNDLRTANYEAIVMIWIGADGRIRRSSLSKSTGVAKMDNAIGQALAAAPALSPPPPDMPQPIHLRISSKGFVEASKS